MANNSNIEWTDSTWNPLAGCTWASPGCDRCYAAVMAHRLDAMAQADVEAGRNPGRKAKYMGVTHKRNDGRVMFNGKINLDEAALNEPFTWKKPRLVFVNSMSDLFHKDVPFEFVAKVFSVMMNAKQHTFQVLTKRPDRMAAFFDWYLNETLAPHWASFYPLPNVWLGTSVEDQDAADKRIPELLKVPARVRFLSCEPLLGPVQISQHLFAGWHKWKPLINWVIVGAESGHGARLMSEDWVRSLRDQCQAAGTAFFYKQDSVAGRKIHVPELDGKQWVEFPQIIV